MLREPGLKPGYISRAEISCAGVFNLLHDRTLLNGCGIWLRFTTS